MDQALQTLLACEHCGNQFVPKSKQRRFCCDGCEFVFGFIKGQGLERFYELREASAPLCPVPAAFSSSAFEMYDDPLLISKFATTGNRMRFFVEGLNCSACLWLLEKIPEFCTDAEWCRVEMGSSTVEVRKSASGSFANIAYVLNRLGFRIRPVRDNEALAELNRKESRIGLIRIGVAGAATGNIMILAVSLYSGATGELARQFQFLSALIAAPVLTFCAWPFYVSTYYSLKARRLNLDAPIVAALVAGILASVWGLVSGTGEVYFDSLSMLVFLLLSSRFALRRIQSEYLKPGDVSEDLLLRTVTRISAAGIREPVSSMALQKGDRIIIDGECLLPVDGTVESGTGVLDVAVMTGESDPIDVSTGSSVVAGARNLAGNWVLCVDRPPSQTRLADILRDTEKSAATKSNFVKFSDLVSQWFITIVGLIAFGVVAYFYSSAPGDGIQRALTLVIVTCPCVFGIAIPLSMSVALRAAARRGIVVKDSNAIERLWSVGKIFFDKTGTLTAGEMAVEQASGDASLWPYAMALEKDQPHPVGKAIVKFLREKSCVEERVFDVSVVSGGGITGRCQRGRISLKPVDGKEVGLGDREEIKGVYALFLNDEPRSYFTLRDRVRIEAKPVLSQFRSKGFRLRLLSGDRRAAVGNCGRQLGFSPEEIYFEASPEIKAQVLRNDRSVTAMVGDGANDAAALAAAGVGIAICGSLEMSLKAADIYLTRPSLTAIADIFKIADRTRLAIRRNLAFSVAFNLIGGTLAVSGLMSPLWAAVLMPVSSVTVLLSAMWTGRQIGKNTRGTI